MIGKETLATFSAIALPNPVKLSKLLFWPDPAFRTSAENMALDHALFDRTRETGVAIARFYQWDSPATTVGYFHRYGEAASLPKTESLPTRRYTGGGLVEHGEDATFLLTFPADSAPAALPGPERYRWIHEAIADSLKEEGTQVQLEQYPNPTATGPCFQNTVGWDLVDPETGKKIGGGAQRRSAGHIIHQGSIRLPENLRIVTAGWISSFLQRLAETVELLPEPARKDAVEASRKWEETQYSSQDWNRWPQGV